MNKAAALLKDRKSTRLNSSHSQISYAVFCLKKKTVELDSGELDRAFRMRRGDYRVHLAGERRVDRGLRGIERGFAVRFCDRADVQLAWFELPALDEGQRAVAPICVRGARHAAEIRLESTGVGMRLDRAAIANEERPADFFHLRDRKSVV